MKIMKVIKQGTGGCMDDKMINICMVSTCCGVLVVLTPAEKEL